jgi:hypothetical protein
LKSTTVEGKLTTRHESMESPLQAGSSATRGDLVRAEDRSSSRQGTVSHEAGGGLVRDRDRS